MKKKYNAPLTESYLLSQESVVCASPSGNEPFNRFTGGSFDD